MFELIAEIVVPILLAAIGLYIRSTRERISKIEESARRDLTDAEKRAQDAVVAAERRAQESITATETRAMNAVRDAEQRSREANQQVLNTVQSQYQELRRDLREIREDIHNAAAAK